MSGSPIKRERNRLFREAILWGLKEGDDPVEYLKPYAERLKKIALRGKLGSAVTLGALREIADRVDGKAAQEIVGNLGVVPTLLIEVMGEREEKVVEGEVVVEIEKKELV